jgi:hypothetical protein
MIPGINGEEKLTPTFSATPGLANGLPYTSPNPPKDQHYQITVEPAMKVIPTSFVNNQSKRVFAVALEDDWAERSSSLQSEMKDTE